MLLVFLMTPMYRATEKHQELLEVLKSLYVTTNLPMPCLTSAANTAKPGNNPVFPLIIFFTIMKNKSSLIVITLLAILCAVSFYIYKNKTSGSTIDKESRDFKIEDTASVTKIFMADKNGNSITLERTKTGWVTPNKYPCRADAINLLLYTMKMLDVKSTVSKNAKAGVIKQMIGHSIKVQAFHNDELIKQYYVGHEGMDNDATYMILTDLDNMENYEDPFLMCIPGFNGYLSSRYILNENEWRRPITFCYYQSLLPQELLSRWPTDVSKKN